MRDVYEAGEDRLLIVATDRISAFDAVLPTPIPDKGRVLTGLSLFWFERTSDLVGNHLVSADPRDLPDGSGDDLAGRAMLVRRADVVPVECVARGYLSGSGLEAVPAEQSVCGVPLPAGLVESDRLPEPIFTPTTKAAAGHDLPLTLDETRDLVGVGLAERLKELTLTIYERAAAIALERGIILADTKFEFGFCDGELILIDEVARRTRRASGPPTGTRRGTAAVVRQAVRPRLAGRDRMGPRAAGPGAAGRGRRADGRPVPGGLRAADRRAVRALPRTDGRSIRRRPTGAQ